MGGVRVSPLNLCFTKLEMAGSTKLEFSWKSLREILSWSYLELFGAGRDLSATSALNCLLGLTVARLLVVGPSFSKVPEAGNTVEGPHKDS